MVLDTVFGEALLSFSHFVIARLYRRTWLSRTMIFGGDLPPHQHALLLRTSKYYRALPAGSQRLFRRRVGKFMTNKKFIGKQGLEVTDDMRLLVSASAIKVTFGLDHFLFEGFPTLILYPSAYRSTSTGAMHKGETHPMGAVVLSWQHFSEGLKHEEDNLHLGIHEFCHALMLDLRKGNIMDPTFDKHMEQLQAMLMDSSMQQKIKASGYLREYANQNFMEFVAVGMESYFETPDIFSVQLPELYAHFSKMLNQDTRRLYLESR